IERLLVLPGKTRSVAEQKPELAVLRSGLHGTLGVVGGGGVIVMGQRLLRRSRHASHFNAAAPADAAAGFLRCPGRRLALALLSFLGRTFGRVGTRRRLIADLKSLCGGDAAERDT